MLQQEQRVADASFFDQAYKSLLQLQRSGVFHATEVENVDYAERHLFIVWQRSYKLSWRFLKF